MKLMFNCREMARLASEELDHPLGFWVKMRMFMHLLMCKDCRTYHDQILCVDKFIDSYYADKSDVKLSLSPEAKARMAAALLKGE